MQRKLLVKFILLVLLFFWIYYLLINYVFLSEENQQQIRGGGWRLDRRQSHWRSIKKIAKDLHIFRKEKGEKKEEEVDDVVESGSSSATSGQPFSGKRVRQFPPEKKIFNRIAFTFDNPSPSNNGSGDGQCRFRTCENWAVSTTIFEPSEAVRRLLYTDLCVVIVGDLDKPASYQIPSSLADEKKIVFLDAEEQRAIGSAFVSRMPWHHFGRKNVGYLFAIGCGAKSIWDFDDDNLFKFWMEGASPDSKLDYRTYSAGRNAKSIRKTLVLENMLIVYAKLCFFYFSDAFTVSTFDKKDLPTWDDLPVFNPYPFLGCPQSPCWPRGFPLTSVVEHTLPPADQMSLSVKHEVPLTSIGVLQSLADHEPDVDAIFRSVMPTPMYFERLPENESDVFLLPQGVFSPYNAQATFHFYRAFFGLYLPVTVHGRVSDIWRGYIAQALFGLCGLHLGFLPRPLVVQDRNVHTVEGDFDSEIPLYKKTRALVQVISEWSSRIRQNFPEASFEELAEHLWVELYERDFLEQDDVFHFQNWFQALNSVGYEFPNLHPEDTGKRPTSGGGHNATLVNLSVGHSIKSSRSDSIPANCNDLPVKRFWTSDLHDGCRMDTPTVLAHLNQTVVVAGVKGAQVPFPEAFSNNKHIWVYDKLSPLLKKKYTGHSYQLHNHDVQQHLHFYKDNPAVNSTDAFVCQFPASMCQIWMPLNKSIVFTAAHRYNLGRCSVQEWTELNRQLEGLSQDKRNVVGGLSRYDVEYIKYYTNLDARLMSSYSGYYLQGHPYRPKRSEILYIDVKVTSEMEGLTPGMSFNIVNVHSLYPRYEIMDLMNHWAMVFIPYSVMSYKLTEFYALGLPLFIPSPKWYRAHGGMGPDRASVSSNYCKNLDLRHAMPKHVSSAHPYNPNIGFEEDAESEMYWLQFSDFYEWPGITYFDDVTDLIYKLKTADFPAIHEQMMEENEYRRHNLLQTWCDVIPNLHEGHLA